MSLSFCKILRHNFKLTVLVSLLIFVQKANSRPSDFDTLRRKKAIISSLSGVYITNMAAMYNLWYKDYKGSSFHIYNDSRDWMGMDKAGHTFSAFVEAKFSSQMFEWAGFNHRKAVILGCAYSFLYQNTFEIFDGYSSEWGFSPADFAANTFGASLVLGQQLMWHENRIIVKYSYHPSSFIDARPDMFGKNFYQNLLKDYNGQTYWLNFNPHSFFKKSKMPKWLDISIGYGATGMYGGEDNIWEKDGKIYNFSHVPRRFEFYLAPDINLEKLKIKKKWLKIALNILNSYKVPLPAIKYTQNSGFKFVPIMF